MPPRALCRTPCVFDKVAVCSEAVDGLPLKSLGSRWALYFGRVQLGMVGILPRRRENDHLPVLQGELAM